MEEVGGKRVLNVFVYFFALGQSKGKWHWACFPSLWAWAPSVESRLLEREPWLLHSPGCHLSTHWQGRGPQEHGDVWGWRQTDVGELIAPVVVGQPDSRHCL